MPVFSEELVRDTGLRSAHEDVRVSAVDSSERRCCSSRVLSGFLHTSHILSQYCLTTAGSRASMCSPK